ncbi:MAG: YicC family protein [Lachnospiraceae bacterium]|jgi:uncharacterized protein (TIGR00255 family)|nr:YicC family protein [Lachnospiraceae bacterium]
MIKSMTGYGRNETTDGERRITAEIRSVNHRHLDLSVKMPRKFGFYEAKVKGLMKSYAKRGKVDVFIGYVDLADGELEVKYNEKVAAEYMKGLKQLQEDFALEMDVRVLSLSRFPEVLTMAELPVDESKVWDGLKAAITGAAAEFVESRTNEGAVLHRDITAMLQAMQDNVDFIDGRMPQIVEDYTRRLREKVENLLADAKVDESRLLTEVAIFADRACLNEELVRLRSHINTMTLALDESDSVGRKLDFIAQEMNREANTIASKTDDIEVINKAIELKTGIEKIREQIQNIE